MLAFSLLVYVSAAASTVLIKASAKNLNISLFLDGPAVGVFAKNSPALGKGDG